MSKTESELWDWVIDYNLRTTHDRDLTSNYGYQSILDVDLIEVCRRLKATHDQPIRILDIGCGSGLAMKQLSEQLLKHGFKENEFECWGMGVNRYEPMYLPDERFILDGVYAHDFKGERFHLILSVFAFHYIWHKLEGVEKIYNHMLVDGGKAYLHFPGYLVRRGESPEAVAQNEVDGNQRFQDFLSELHAKSAITSSMKYTKAPYYSDDGDCALLAEFGCLSFEREANLPLSFDQLLRAFTMFEKGFAFKHMDTSPRTYIASHYDPINHFQERFGHPLPSASIAGPGMNLQPADRPASATDNHPYRITSLPIQTDIGEVLLDLAVHEYDSENIVIICPGARETLAGRVITYPDLARSITKQDLGAVVRYNDPFDHYCNYANFLMEKLRQTIDYTLEQAEHFSATKQPKLRLIAYSSSAGAAAALAADYECIESLLLIAPSHDVPKELVAPKLAQFQGNVSILIGEDDEIVLPKQAFWYYQQALNANKREYVEVPSCGHTFEGHHNKSIFLAAPQWAFGETRPEHFPKSTTTPSEIW